jgi:hypothetical protein
MVGRQDAMVDILRAEDALRMTGARTLVRPRLKMRSGPPPFEAQGKQKAGPTNSKTGRRRKACLRQAGRPYKSGTRVACGKLVGNRP